jgi:hypothetical protein
MELSVSTYIIDINVNVWPGEPFQRDLSAVHYRL